MNDLNKMIAKSLDHLQVKTPPVAVRKDDVTAAIHAAMAKVAGLGRGAVQAPSALLRQGLAFR